MTAQDILTVPEAAELLRVDQKNLYALVKAGKVRGAFRVGKSWRIRKDKLMGDAA